MDVKKAKLRIKSLLYRTETNGASPAEADAAARMVCKLLLQHPEILGDKPIEHAWNSDRPPFPGSEQVSVRYHAIRQQNEKEILLSIKGSHIWLPLKLITLKTSVVWMPRWLAQLHKLI